MAGGTEEVEFTEGKVFLDANASAVRPVSRETMKVFYGAG